ncbi:MAG: hypothetical protein EOM52_10040, partial [Clostridia bacterium]|nr:hypothetical protein [Clostridia bacterium]
MKYEQLISRMTLEEKCALLSGQGNFTSKAISRLGIPAMFLSDGPHGLRKQAGATDHLGLNASLRATCYPTAATMATSWDTALGEELGAMLGEEAAAQRVNVLLGPGLNMKRSPLCGRNFEYFSEDPYLAGKLAAAYIQGIQSKGVSACPKHFAANSQETLRMSSDCVVDRRTFRELYLTGFEIAVKEGHPQSIMSSYNKINGVYANEDPALLKDILRDEWGFDGMVVTDWGGSNDHVSGVKAGSTLEMPAPGAYSDLELVEAVRRGELDEADLDRRVEELLKVVLATQIPADAPETFDEAAHHAFAARAAEQCVVLLKNEGGILPLAPGKRVAVVGDFAQTPRYQGAGSSNVNPTRLDTPLDALSAAGVDVAGFAPGFLRNGGADEGQKRAAVELARGADVVLVYLGLAEVAEVEGMDRPHMRLAANQVEVLNAVAAVNPNVVVVLAGGAPVETPWLDACRGLVHGYLGGQAGATAMARILTGRANPSGKLAETWPLGYEDTPAYGRFPGGERTAEYREGPYIGYRYYQTAQVPVRFPFGFGLSYTRFEYADLKATAGEVSFTLTNTGAVAGAEVAQVYVSLPGGAVFRPSEELKGFAKVHLEPGESRTVTIPLDDKAFRYFNEKTGAFEVEGGTYEIRVGASVRDIRLTAPVEISGTGAPSPYDPAQLPSYYSGKVREVPDGEFETLLGHPIPDAKWDRSASLGRNDTVSQLCYARSAPARLAWRVISGKKRKAEAAGKPDLNILSIYNMPFRGIAKLMGPMVNMEMVDAILVVGEGLPKKGTTGAQRRLTAIRAAEVAAQRSLAELLKGVSIAGETTVRDAEVESDLIKSSVSAFIKGFQPVVKDWNQQEETALVILKVGVNGPKSFGAMMYEKILTEPRIKQEVEKPVYTPPVDLPAPPPVAQPFDGLIIDATAQPFRPALINRIFNPKGEVLYDPAKISQKVLVEQGCGEYTNSVDKA